MFLNKIRLTRCILIALSLWLSGCALKERLETQQPEPVQQEVSAQALQDRKLFSDAFAMSRSVDASEQDLRTAMNIFDQLYQSNQSYLGALANAGDMAFRLKDFELAEEKYKLLLEQALSAKDAQTPIQKGDTQEVNAPVEQNTAADGTIKEKFAVHSLNQLGLLARQNGQFEQAEAYYRKALALAPEQAEIVRNLAILLDLYQGKLAEALALYQQYQGLLDEEDAQVKDWIFDLKNRLPAETTNE